MLHIGKEDITAYRDRPCPWGESNKVVHPVDAVFRAYNSVVEMEIKIDNLKRGEWEIKTIEDGSYYVKTPKGLEAVMEPDVIRFFLKQGKNSIWKGNGLLKPFFEERFQTEAILWEEHLDILRKCGRI